jgi:HEAT repeat protein
MKYWTGMIWIFLTLVGCARPASKGLMDEDPSFKIPAIKQAAETHDIRAIPQLIESLDDDDPAVRFYAIEALKRLTGETFGYRFYEDESQRRIAVGKWKDWLEKHPQP